MKKQNDNKKTLATIVASLMIGVIMMSPLEMLSYADAVSETNTPNSIHELEKTFPDAISDSDLSKIKHLAVANDEVQQFLHGKSYNFTETDYIGNFKTHPGVWYPEIHINVGGTKELTVVADLKNNSILKIEKHDMQKKSIIPLISPSIKPESTSSPKAIDYYTGSGSVSGIYMTTTAAGYSPSDSVEKFFDVNGIETGANDTLGCIPADAYNNYFAQAGFAFKGTGAYPQWTDTSSGCYENIPANATYTSSDSYVFYIMVKASGKWFIYGSDQTSGYQFFHIDRIAPASTTMKVNDPNTSIFFENYDTGNSWAGDFAANPSASSSLYQSGSWTNWSAEQQVDVDNAGNWYYYPYTGNVISGTLTSGSTATWSMSNMQNYPY